VARAERGQEAEQYGNVLGVQGRLRRSAHHEAGHCLGGVGGCRGRYGGIVAGGGQRPEGGRLERPKLAHKVDAPASRGMGRVSWSALDAHRQWQRHETMHNIFASYFDRAMTCRRGHSVQAAVTLDIAERQEVPHTPHLELDGHLNERAIDVPRAAALGRDSCVQERAQRCLGLG
jgi:hypothetical protein